MLTNTLLIMLTAVSLFLFGNYSFDANSNSMEETLPISKIPNMDHAAEAYFSPNSQSLIFNAKMGSDTDYMVYTGNIDGTAITQINNRGKDGCSFYYPSGDRIIWTSTRDRRDLEGNYSDPDNYPQGAELYSSNLDGSDIVRLTTNEQYDAEVSVSPDGNWVLFTRQIDGQLDLWKMRADGTDQHQITFTPEWQEGGAFYMPDNQTILLRAWKKSDQSREGSLDMTIFTINHDGTNLKQITADDSGTNWSPYPAPDGKHFFFVKLLPRHNYEIFMMNIETKEQTRLTFNPGFDGFPAISPDGKTMAFSSSRDTLAGQRYLGLYLMDISSLNVHAQ